MLRNNGTVQAETIAVQFLPKGADRKIDEPDPLNCHFLSLKAPGKRGYAGRALPA